MIDNPDQIKAPILKVTSAIAISGVTSNLSLVEWVQIVSGSLAALYSAVLLGEWFWKKALKPWLLRTGRIKPKLITLDTEVEEG